MFIAKEPLILEGIPGLLERKSRPGHVGIPRARMDLPFAVLLMRKSYEVAGNPSLPHISMQRSFDPTTNLTFLYSNHIQH